MRKSEPKPKIIYRKIEDLIRSSSLRVKINHQLPQNFKCITKMDDSAQIKSVLGDKMKTLENSRNMQKSLSRHSIKSKEKLKIFPGIINTQSTQNHKQIRPELLHEEIDAVYQELEQFFIKSKQQFVLQLSNNSSSEQKINELEQMADYIKHIIQFYIKNDKQMKLAPVKQPQTTICTEISEDFMLSSMSKQNKLRANKRMESLSSRNHTIYERILLENEKKVKRKEVMRR